MLRRRTVITGIAAAGILVAGGTAYTAAVPNTLVNSKTAVGSSAVTVTGGTLTNLAYHQVTLDPTKIDTFTAKITVGADITVATGEVKARLTSNGTDAVSGANWADNVCVVSQATTTVTAVCTPTPGGTTAVPVLATDIGGVDIAINHGV